MIDRQSFSLGKIHIADFDPRYKKIFHTTLHDPQFHRPHFFLKKYTERHISFEKRRIICLLNTKAEQRGWTYGVCTARERGAGREGGKGRWRRKRLIVAAERRRRRGGEKRSQPPRLVTASFGGVPKCAPKNISGTRDVSYLPWGVLSRAAVIPFFFFRHPVPSARARPRKRPSPVVSWSVCRVERRKGVLRGGTISQE